MRLKFKKGYQSNLLKQFKLAMAFSKNREMAFFFEVKEKTLKNWINERNTLPEQIFNQIIETKPKFKKFTKFIIKNLDDNWGAIKGGMVRTQEKQQVILRMTKLREDKERKRQYIDSKKKKFLRKPLKKAWYKKLKKHNINLKKVLAVAILTDGSLSISGSRICYYTKDEELKYFVFFLLNEVSSFSPTLYKYKKKEVYFVRVSDKNLANELRSLSPNFKTSPSQNQEIKDYMAEPQPNLNFLIHSNLETKQFCLRLAFTTDGSISKFKDGRFELTLACHHPQLCKQWIQILKGFDICSYLGNDKKTWAGVDGVRIYKKDSIIKFRQMDGFIDGVKISKKSKIYKGLEKNKLLAHIDPVA